MNNDYTTVFVTNVPSFYKLNLYNKLANKTKIFVIFCSKLDSTRNADFVKGSYNFEYANLTSLNVVMKLFWILKFIWKNKYNELIVGGWDLVEYWLFVLLSFKKNNAVVVESSCYESTSCGIKGFIKKMFLSRISTVYASGKSNQALVKSLGFQGKIKITHGVGLFNIIKQPEYQERKLVKNFLYVGRFIEVKNLKFLISVFNKHPELTLNMVGFGPQEGELKAMAKENIIFHGAIDNKRLSSIYQSNDVFILPSYLEPWGLVVEEALNNGTPIILSDKIGCKDDLLVSNGLEFQCNSEQSLHNAISKIVELDFYNSLRLNISKMNFEDIENKQLNAYID